MKIFEKKQVGFTLLELLFIIVIIAIVVSIALTSYQQRTNNLKIDKTALQMQQIMQAATKFHIDNAYWPDSSNPPADFTGHYLPIGSATNPWGQTFTYSLDKLSNTFQVFSGTTPNTTFANRIRSLLPNASIDTNNSSQVVFSNNSSGTQSAPAIKTIGRTGLLLGGSTFSFAFDCAVNQKAQTAVTPYYIGATNYETHWCGPEGTRGFGLLGAIPISIKVTTTGNISHYAYTYIAVFNGTIQDIHYIFCQAASDVQNAGNVSFTYIGYCLPQ